MLAISRREKTDVCVVNVLPCRINHDGAAKVTKRHWITSNEADGIQTAHFRGRRLRGRRVKLPDQYQGLVLKSTDKTIIEPPPLGSYDDDDEAEPEMPEPVKVVEEVSKIEEMTIWGHDQAPAAEDNFVRSVEEWIAFSEAIHGR